MTDDLIEHDKQQRQLALDAGQSFIVQAPAGSGKTELLIQRFLTLLNHVKTPEEIFAITFTKKAANEMRLRVIKALKQAATDPEPLSDHGKQTWRLAKSVLARDEQFHWNLINNPNQLRILTIDALCAYLTKQLPLLSHFGAQPSIADNAFVLYREAVQEVLLHVEEGNTWSEALANLLLHLDNDLNKLHDLLVSLLAKREQWLPYIQLETSDLDIRKSLERQLALVIEDNLASIRDIFPRSHVPELMAIARFAANNVALSHPDADIVACSALMDLPTHHSDNKRAWLGLASLLLTKSHQFRKKVDEKIGFTALANLKNPVEKAEHNEYRERWKALIGHLCDREDLRLALSELSSLPDSRYQNSQWKILQSLFQILKLAAGQLRLVFQQYGQIDFVENAQAAQAALGEEGNPTDLALALDYQIKHILIDEFQDTSFTQYQMLEKLTVGWEQGDGRTLFIVGDPMQSIYRFREAEVGLFIRMWKSGIGHLHLTPLVLSLNFRSSANIVEWNNTHFDRIFPSFNDIATGAVKFSRSVPPPQGEADAMHSTIAIHGFADAGDKAQTNHIIELIQTIKSQHPNEKTAILVRSRSHLTDIIPALREAKIAYRAVDIDPLVSRQIIVDLLALTCALLHPADRIAWLSVLRAPWCGINLADMLIIAGEHPHSAISSQLERADVLAQLSTDGKARINRVYPILKAKIAERERDDLRSWVESTWLLIGGPACLNDIGDIEDVNAYFTLLDEFRQANPIINLEKLKEKIEKLYASTQHDDATIQIMTIHTAKGLEFDTVIIPHLERKMPYDDKSLLQWMERPLNHDQVALLLAPIQATGDGKDTIYEYIGQQQRIKSEYETDRLLYVATTRAKKRLYLCFNATPKADNDYKKQSGSFLEKLWPFIEKQKNSIITHASMETTDTTLNDKINGARHDIKRLVSTWSNPISEFVINTLVSHQKQTGFRLPNILPQIIGTVTHLTLEQISLLGFDWWELKSLSLHQRYLEHHFKQLGVSKEKLSFAVHTALTGITNTLNDKRGRWILSPHKEAQSEYKLSAILGDHTDNLVIDRLFIDEEGIRWIIDYKTSDLDSQNTDKALALEQSKYQEQMLKYYHAVKKLDNRPTRLGLYFPSLPAWKEWDVE